MTDAEKVVVPENSNVARSVVDVDAAAGHITYLDPQTGFRPRKNGAFTVDVVLSDLIEPYATAEEAAHKKSADAAHSAKLFDLVGKEFVESIAEGYHAGIVVCGAGHVGKTYTLFGDAAPLTDHGKGLLPRIAEHLFAKLALKPTNTKCVVELEFVEVQSDTVIVDLFRAKAGGASKSPSSSMSLEQVKIREEGDVIVLQNASRQTVENAQGFMTTVRTALKSARKTKTYHVALVIHVHETSSFRDPNKPDNTVQKSHSTRSVIALMSGAPTTFFRCVDTASKRELGEAQLKVPARESALTRILSQEFFGGNCRSSCVVCVSPFVEHVKDSISMLAMCSKFYGVKHAAKLVVDHETLQFRRLADEVKGLEHQLSQAHSSRQVVQDELNRRQRALEDVSARYELQQDTLRDASYHSHLEELVMGVKKIRLQKEIRRMEDQIDALDDELEELQGEATSLRKQQTVLATSTANNEALTISENQAAEDGQVTIEELRPKVEEERSKRVFVEEVNVVIGKDHEAMVARHTAKKEELRVNKETDSAKITELEAATAEIAPKHRIVKMASTLR